MKKTRRDIFTEIREGFTALADERAGMITLTRRPMEVKPAPAITADEILALRRSLNPSRAVFARALRTDERTLENWEQGRARPNA